MTTTPAPVKGLALSADAARTMTPRGEDAASTAPLVPAPAPGEPDALALLDQRTRGRLRPPGLAARGPHLAFASPDGPLLLPLGPNLTHIGRGPSAAVRIEDPRISRSHAIIVRHGRSVRLLDNRSANGTFVGGRRIVAVELAPGDTIGLGPVTVQFVVVV